MEADGEGEVHRGRQGPGEVGGGVLYVAQKSEECVLWFCSVQPGSRQKLLTRFSGLVRISHQNKTRERSEKGPCKSCAVPTRPGMLGEVLEVMEP